MSQFNFDIMDAAGYGYYRVWKERAYLLKLAAVPLLIKFACTVVVITMDMDSSLLRAGLMMLPGDFALGWLVAQFLRTLLMEERWPMLIQERPDETTFARLLLRARGIVASTLVFVLIAMVAKVLMYLVLSNLSGDDLAQVKGDQAMVMELESVAAGKGSAPSPYDPLIFLGSIAGLVALIWSFRLIWLHIPFAVLMGPADYLKAVKGFMSSVRMMLLHFCSMTPIMLVGIILMQVITGAFDLLGDAGDMPAKFFSVLVKVMTEILVSLIGVTSMSWAMKSFLPLAPNALKDFPKKAE